VRRLDPRQRKALEPFRQSETFTSGDVGKLFAISQRTARNLLTAWSEKAFVVVADPARKSRKYTLSDEFRRLLE